MCSTRPDRTVLVTRSQPRIAKSSRGRRMNIPAARKWSRMSRAISRWMAGRGEFLPTIFLLQNLLLAIMFPRRRSLNLFHPVWVAVFLGCVLCGNSMAQRVVLYLKNGDKLTGVLVSEYTNRVVLSNTWVKDLSVPLSEIAQREIILANTN